MRYFLPTEIEKHTSVCIANKSIVMKCELEKQFGKQTATKMEWHISLIPVLGRQRQEDLHEFQASLVYTES